MQFSYLILPGDPSKTPRPLVPVVYRSRKKQTKPILTLIDSGADYSFVTMKVALYLGIKLTGIKPVSIRGFEGSVLKCFPYKTAVVVAGESLVLPIYFGGSLTDEYPCILGQDFFFDKTKITFERYNWSFRIDWL